MQFLSVKSKVMQKCALISQKLYSKFIMSYLKTTVKNIYQNAEHSYTPHQKLQRHFRETNLSHTLQVYSSLSWNETYCATHCVHSLQ